MGIRGSKAYSCSGSGGGGGGGSPSYSSSRSWRGNGKKVRCRGSRVFQSSCLGAPSGSRYTNDNDHHNVRINTSNGSENDASSMEHKESDVEQVKVECYGEFKSDQSDDIPRVSLNVELDELSEARIANLGPRTGSSSTRVTSTRSLASPSSFLSRFSFVPGNVSFRLGRATSVGSSRAYPASSSSMGMSDDEEEFGSRPSANAFLDPLPASQTIRSLAQRHGDASPCLHLCRQMPDSSNDMQENPIIVTGQGAAREVGGAHLVFDQNLLSSQSLFSLDGTETRRANQRGVMRERTERNVRFSRTLSVGRLRDRVLRRSSVSDLTFCPLQQEREVRTASPGSWVPPMDAETSVFDSEENAFTSATRSHYPSSNMSNSSLSQQDHDMETPRSREARYHDLLEHRSNFLERRRRIRSQVRALQRLGSRFENLSGHGRSCILSGQHRTGRCTCRMSNQDASANDDSSARASISRIVMLAEALFEVLDEIHQQSVVLSSRNSVSSLGSVPAPIDVVESLPLKLYTKSQKHQNEEAAQCYICLVEYEEGDGMRILPCHHEFHRTCIDKWLKEIHRVCPLCRRDICRSDSFSAENQM